MKQTKVFQSPPDIFWIDPNGFVRSVIGYLSSIQANPGAYGLHAAPKAENFNEVKTLLFQKGWLLGSFRSGRFYFLMERPRGIPMGNAYNLVRRFQDQAVGVHVDFFDRRFKFMGNDMTAAEFLSQKFPARWGIQ
jgi:hypothetical protein